MSFESIDINNLQLLAGDQPSVKNRQGYSDWVGLKGSKTWYRNAHWIFLEFRAIYYKSTS